MVNFSELKVVTAMVTPMRKVSDSVCADQIGRQIGSQIGHQIDGQTGSVLDNVTVDFEQAEKLSKYLVAHGSDALVLSGTTGEAPTTHIEEKAELIKRIKAVVEVPIIAGTGSNDTIHAIRNTEIAEHSGADAALVVTPYYSRPSQEGLERHFEAVANSTKLPVILYDVPGRSGVRIDTKTYVKLARIENIVAIKDATGDVYGALKTISAVNRVRSEQGFDPMTLFAGDDSLLLPFLNVGATGIISVASHFVGEQFNATIEAFQKGDPELALEIFNETTPYIDACNGAGQQAAATKALLRKCGIINTDDMRLPNVSLPESVADKLFSSLTE